MSTGVAELHRIRKAVQQNQSYSLGLISLVVISLVYSYFLDLALAWCRFWSYAALIYVPRRYHQKNFCALEGGKLPLVLRYPKDVAASGMNDWETSARALERSSDPGLRISALDHSRKEFVERNFILVVKSHAGVVIFAAAAIMIIRRRRA
jgi:uncharacterized membrane protein